jgi:hypothetical protein
MKRFKPGDFVITNENYPGVKSIALIESLRIDFVYQYNVVYLTQSPTFSILFGDEMTLLCT